MALKIIERVKDSLKTDEGQMSVRLQGIQRMLEQNIGESNFSWGLLVLAFFGVLSVVELALAIVRLFS